MKRGLLLLVYLWLPFHEHYSYRPRYLPEYHDMTRSGCKQVWIVQNRFHSLFVFHRADVEGIFDTDNPPYTLTDTLPPSDFVDVGWGEKHFFQSADVGVGDAFRALLWRNRSVLRISAFSISFEERYGKNFRHAELRMDTVQFRLLLTSIQRQCEYPLRITSSHNSTVYYSTHGWYYCLNNCNTWLLERCDDAGMPVPWRNTLLAEQVIETLRSSPP